ncbi:hypothetical protein GCM10023196_056150 [Actinoallomurus vinaceus]|uniref:Ricin B lectin domain-containing protein n=1 Tax=Actinoallomurus vinaceus TaxID=1080074 RepID=A0ABP8UHE4_9ACTN
MKKPHFTRRITVAAAIATTAVTGVAVEAAPAHASTTYWSFKNQYNHNCLTFSLTTTRVWTSACGNESQQWWDWVPSNISNFSMLKAKGRNLCLRTDHKSATNAVWLSSCDKNADGEAFQYQYYTKALVSSPYLDFIAADNNSDAVYSVVNSSSTSYWDYDTHVA